MWWNIFLCPSDVCKLFLACGHLYNIARHRLIQPPLFWNGKWWVKSGWNRLWVRRHGFTKSSNSRWYSGTKYCNQAARPGWNTNTQKRNMVVPITWKLATPSWMEQTLIIIWVAVNIKVMVFPVVLYGCEMWTIKKAEHWRIDAFEMWCCRRFLRVPWTARRSNQLIIKEINPDYSMEGLMLKLKPQSFVVIWCEELTRWKRHCWERSKATGEAGSRRWDGWMASLTQWTWIWANSGRQWRTEESGMLQSMGLQRVGQDLAIEQQQKCLEVGWWVPSGSWEAAGCWWGCGTTLCPLHKPWKWMHAPWDTFWEMTT